MKVAPMPALAGLAAGASWLLPRMRREFETAGQMTGPTAAVMWCEYTAAAGLYLRFVAGGRALPPGPRAAALTAVVAGLGMTAADMSAFTGVGQVTGSSTGPLATGGIYRLSRNPQYVGYILAGTAGAVARRSTWALGLTAGYAAICHWWVHIEEQALERQFGDDYRRFRADTPRWIGLPRTRTG